MIWIIFALLVIFTGVAAYLFILSASRLYKEAEDMYDLFKELKKQGVIK